MLTELIIYELVTGVAPFVGIKVWADKKYLRGINQPKTSPFDGYLKRRIGKMSKTEIALSNNATKAIKHLVKYQAFKYLLVIASREARKQPRRLA